MNENDLQKITLTCSAACGAVSRVLINEKIVPPKKSIADLAYKILEALGFDTGIH